MVRRLDTADAPVPSTADALAEAAPCTIEAWIALLERLLDLRDTQRHAVCSEIESHLLERVRDLELTGRASDDAVRQALAEVGEAAVIARTLRAAHRRRRRRTVMNLSLLGLCGVGVGVGVLSIAPGTRGVAYSIFEPVASDPPAEVATRMVSADGTTLEAAIIAIGDAAELPVVVDWDTLDGHDCAAGRELGVAMSGVELGRACEMVLERLGPDAGLAWRFRPEYLELGEIEAFDYRERQLLVYDVEDVLQHLLDAYGIEWEDAAARVSDLFYEFVEPDNWNVNGGRVAQLNIVGGRMFVEAPPRMHDRVAWMLGELEDAAVVSKATPEATNPALGFRRQ